MLRWRFWTTDLLLIRPEGMTSLRSGIPLGRDRLMSVTGWRKRDGISASYVGAHGGTTSEVALARKWKREVLVHG